jgi:serine protease AprX
MMTARTRRRLRASRGREPGQRESATTPAPRHQRRDRQPPVRVREQDKYNIRVVNLSLRSDVPQSYTTDPLDAAVELLTFRGILVVASAGNIGTAGDAVSYAPANDPFVLTVGAVDDHGTADYGDDTITSWSSRGTTDATPSRSCTRGRRIAVLSPAACWRARSRGLVGEHYFQLPAAIHVRRS